MRKELIGHLITDYGKDMKDIGIFEIFYSIELNILHIIILSAFPMLYYNITEHHHIRLFSHSYLIEYIDLQVQKYVLLLYLPDIAGIIIFLVPYVSIS